jgi:hypothetical protein
MSFWSLTCAAPQLKVWPTHLTDLDDELRMFNGAGRLPRAAHPKNLKIHVELVLLDSKIGRRGEEAPLSRLRMLTLVAKLSHCSDVTDMT